MKIAMLLVGVMCCFSLFAIAEEMANVESGEDVTLASDESGAVSEGDQVDVFHPETGKYDTEEVTSVNKDSGVVETDDMTEGVENTYDAVGETPDESLDMQYGDGEDM